MTDSPRRHCQSASPRAPAWAGDCLVLLVTTFVLCLTTAATAATVEETRLVAVDMGAEWIKTATLDFISTPDHPPAAAVSILLNDQANRKSPPCVAFRCGSRLSRHSGAEQHESACERSFAEEALSLSPRFPTQVVCGPALLLGYTTEEAVRDVMVAAAAREDDNASQALLAASAEQTMRLPMAAADDHFLFRVLVDARRAAFHVQLPNATGAASRVDGSDGLTFNPEELTAMLLGQLTETAHKRDVERNGLGKAGGARRGHAVHSPGPRVRHAAVTVPSFSTVAERQALVDAGEVSGLRVVRLVHSVTAAATALAYYREEAFFAPGKRSNAAPAYVMILDMGSRQTEAAVFAFTPYTPPVPADGVRLGEGHGGRRRGVVGQISLVAMATNRTLGGAAFDQCIARHWDDTFLQGRVFTRRPADASAAARREAGKQRAALLRAANKARERLSANREAPVTVEGVVDGAGNPFTTTLSRATFEDLCDDLFTAAVRVRDVALNRASARMTAAAAAGSNDSSAFGNGGVSGGGDRTALALLAKLQRFEVVGGASRMPKLLDRISQGYGSGGGGGLVDRTLNGDEAVAVGTAYLGAVAADMLPRRFTVREALTNDIGAFLLLNASAHRSAPVTATKLEVVVQSVGSEGGAASGRRGGHGGQPSPPALFPAHHTLLPATRTVLLPNLSHDFLFTLASPPALAEAVLRQQWAGAGAGAPGKQAAVCPGCFMQHHSVKGVESAVAQAAAVARVHTRGNVTARVNATEVVLEAAVSENGLPYLRKAFVRAHYIKEESSKVVDNTTAGAAAAAVAAAGEEAGEDVDGGGAAPKEREELNTTIPEQEDEQQQQQQQQQQEGDDGARGDANDADRDEEDAVAADSNEGTATEAQQAVKKTDGADEKAVAVKFTSFTRVFPLQASVVYPQQDDNATQAALPRGINLTPRDLEASRATLRQLQQADDYRYACSNLRNTLEGHLISLRLLDAYGEELDITADMLAKAGLQEKEEGEGAVKQHPSPSLVPSASSAHGDLLRWRAVVAELSDWLDTYGETASLTELDKANARVEALASGVLRVFAK